MIPMFHEVPVACINQAAEEYQVPAPLIMAIVLTENGKIGTESRNENGTYDLGIMQINSSWADTFEKQGYSLDDITYNSCKNIDMGTLILSNCLKKNPNIVEAIGDYHSHTPYYNLTYADKVMAKYNQINAALKNYISPECAKNGLIC
ncbi:MAG: lytic transglycosylase domain-containing protein [Gammaproteobacteria bacterium]|nr:lytic transglycosylase domain-containing protein [Gammaproteobacteria bacterium]